jgi:hypothetical protein
MENKFDAEKNKFDVRKIFCVENIIQQTRENLKTQKTGRQTFLAHRNTANKNNQNLNQREAIDQKE